MKTRKEILKELNTKIKMVEQPACVQIWGTNKQHCPEPFEYEKFIYDKETRLLTELLLDIRDKLDKLSPDTK